MMPPRTDGSYAKARAAIARFRIAARTPDPAFDVFVNLVCAALDVPSALLGFFDGDTLCIKAAVGRLQRTSAAGDQLRDAFEHERPILVSGDAHFLCVAPVFAPDGQAVGVIAGFDKRARVTTTAMRLTMETIALAVTHALEARKNATVEPPATHAFFAFDAADLSVLFADAETVRHRNATPEQLQSLTFDDVFSGVDDHARHELEIVRETMSDRPLTFLARTLGHVGFWFPVTCTARAVRARLRSIIVIEFALPSAAPERPNLRALALQAERRSRWDGHSIEAVLSKIEAGRRALRAERGEIDEPLSGKAFVSAAAQLLADNGGPHVLAVFAPGSAAVTAAIERARRVRLLCDHDLVAVLDGTYIAMLLRDMPVSIGHRAIERFARSLPHGRFSVRDTSGSDERVLPLLEAAIEELRTADRP